MDFLNLEMEIAFFVSSSAFLVADSKFCNYSAALSEHIADRLALSHVLYGEAQQLSQ